MEVTKIVIEISFFNIYRESNSKANHISKEALYLQELALKEWEFKDGFLAFKDEQSLS